MATTQQPGNGYADGILLVGMRFKIIGSEYYHKESYDYNAYNHVYMTKHLLTNNRKITDVIG